MYFKFSVTVLPDALAAIVTGLEVLNTVKIRSEEITIENLSLGEALYVQNGLKIIDQFTKLLQLLDADSFSMDFSKAADRTTRKINEYD